MIYMENIMIDEINQGIQDWLSIIDYKDKDQTKWCRKNITELRKQIFENKKKEKKHLS